MKKPTKSLPKKETKQLAREFKLASSLNTYIGWGTAAQFRDTPTDAKGFYQKWPTQLHICHTRMPGCCGISLLSNFYDPEAATAETRKAFLKAALEEVSRRVHTGGVIVTTSVSEQPNCVETLLEIGFKEVAKCGNPNSGNTVSTFFYILADEGTEQDDGDYEDEG